MKNMGNINLSSLSNLRRFHMVIFIVFVVIGLSAAILLLNGIVAKTSDPTVSSETGAQASFDQTTINRIKELKAASEPSAPIDFSQGRISPFTE
jgi:hypothetical protein